MWRRVIVVFAKEVVDNIRDRRSLLLALVYPLMGPVLLGVMIALVTGMVLAYPRGHVRLWVQGGEFAPELMAFLEDEGATIRTAPDDPEAHVRRGRLKHVVVIPETFRSEFAAQRPATVKLFVNSSRLSGLVAVNQTIDLLEAYSREVGGRRLAERGVDPQVAQPVTIENVSVTRGTHLGDLFLLMVPPFIIFTVFMGGVYLAIDTTSGERERGSLEPLLINPIERTGLMLGKFMAALLFTAVAVIVQLIAFKIIFYFAGGAGSTFDRNLGPGAMLGIFMVALPLMMLAVAVQVIIATVTRSFKEAQTYLGLLPLVPAIPGMALVFAPVQEQTWMMTLPAFSQTLVFGTFMRGEVPGLGPTLVSMSATALVALLLVALAAWLYEREQLIFGG